MTLSGDRSGDWLAKALQRSGIGRPAAQRGHGRPTLCQTGSGVVPALSFFPFPLFPFLMSYCARLATCRARRAQSARVTGSSSST
ncbi:hypothetical protein, partial [Gluconobacter cerinus]|uniref:hypothetical protein n=1 Tax=Gluconobacter cerinus TaxID=38307 RepID=UPI00222FA95A